MRLISVLVFMAMAGCASNGSGMPIGEHFKNGQALRVERMGSMTTLASYDQSVCHSDKVLLCRGEAEDGDCRCVTIHEAERSLRSVAHDRQGFRTGKRH